MRFETTGTLLLYSLGRTRGTGDESNIRGLWKKAGRLPQKDYLKSWLTDEVPPTVPTPSATPEPSIEITPSPSSKPVAGPTLSPIASPTDTPTDKPSLVPTPSPSNSPTKSPVTTFSPTTAPIESPTRSPTSEPTVLSTESPSNSPTHTPIVSTESPTVAPTSPPTMLPTAPPSVVSISTFAPTAIPIMTLPTFPPTQSPNVSPTTPIPSVTTTTTPTANPTYTPTTFPTGSPNASPTTNPTFSPTNAPTFVPTKSPTARPTQSPTNAPTFVPTESPTARPTQSPTNAPTFVPTESPTASPIVSPTIGSTDMPTESPTARPTQSPTNAPTFVPTERPTASPTVLPTSGTTDVPTESPSMVASPTVSPTIGSTDMPTISPSAPPTLSPISLPTAEPTLPPFVPVTETPTSIPTITPTFLPTTQSPTLSPSTSGAPSETPSSSPTFDCEANDLSETIIQEVNDDEIKDVDESGPGFTTGDVFVFDNLLFATDIGRIGRVFGRCVVLENVEQADNTYCSMHFDFPAGELYMQGVYFDMPIVAGTNCYLGNEGVVSGDASVETIEYEVGLQDTDRPPRECPDQILDEPSWIEDEGDTFIDVDKSGSETPGDVFVFDSNDILAGRQRASTSGECVVLVTESFDNTYCQISYEFREGTLMVQGVFGNMVIVGGTGCFRQAKGTIRAESLDGDFFRHNVTFSDGVQPDNCDHQELFTTTWTEVGDDVLSDCDGDGAPSVGEMFVFDNHPITIGDAAEPSGISVGRCAFLPGFQDDDSLVYCLISFEFDQGTLVVQGLYTEMEIVGGSGCFEDVRGRVFSTNLGDDTFQYTFEIYEQ